MLFLVSGKETARATWEALNIMHMGVERVKDSQGTNSQDRVRGAAHEGVGKFSARLTTIVNKI